jgi:cystine transport system ATP-binding protein/L-cystine transport system ATP-binding protein
MAEGFPNNQETILSWRNLSVHTGGEEIMVAPDLDIKRGEAVLILHDNDRFTEGLARCASGIGHCQGELAWLGAKKPPENDFLATLTFFKKIAYVGPDSQLISNTTLLHHLIFEMEYNQNANGQKARQLALDCLESLGLAPLANLPPDKLFGQTRYVSLMALAISRKPALFILERPMGLLRPLLFARVIEAIGSGLKENGQAALILDNHRSGYREKDYDRVLDLGDIANQEIKKVTAESPMVTA